MESTSWSSNLSLPLYGNQLYLVKAIHLEADRWTNLVQEVEETACLFTTMPRRETEILASSLISS